jgi:hypothetical protein
MRNVLALLVTGGMLSTMVACGNGASSAGEDGPIPGGNALLVDGGYGIVHRGIIPGDRYIDMLGIFKNKAQRPVRIHRVEPREFKGEGRIARIYRISLGPRTGRNLPALSQFEFYPPREKRGKGCVEQPVVPVNGFVVRPDDYVVVLLFIEAMRRGTFVIDGLDVTYEHAGRIYHQVIPYEHKGEVGRKQRPLEPREKKCASGTSELLIKH